MKRILLLVAVLALALPGCYPADENGKGPISNAKDERNAKINAEMEKKAGAAMDEEK